MRLDLWIDLVFSTEKRRGGIFLLLQPDGTRCPPRAPSLDAARNSRLVRRPLIVAYNSQAGDATEKVGSC